VEPERGPHRGALSIPPGALRLGRLGRTGTIRAGWTATAAQQRCSAVATITARQARTVGLRAPAGAATVVIARGEAVAERSGPAPLTMALPRTVRDALVKVGTSLRVRLDATIDGESTTLIVTIRR
jgi:hypothetical protein